MTQRPRTPKHLRWLWPADQAAPETPLTAQQIAMLMGAADQADPPENEPA